MITTTQSSKKEINLESITIEDNNLFIITKDEQSAKHYLKRNPMCLVDSDEQGRHILIYSLTEVNLLNILKKG
jgi:hypothetical protein